MSQKGKNRTKGYFYKNKNAQECGNHSFKKFKTVKVRKGSKEMLERSVSYNTPGSQRRRTKVMDVKISGRKKVKKKLLLNGHCRQKSHINIVNHNERITLAP